ncbi:hypothetical protein YG5714_2347 [Sulfolobus islandicus Y.G.57.14]|uniref:Uncharacterized protein n=1 Tax=Saccharolobus islandicus (strain Y.G.57.14 / Yellowstone \|nr:hypothetical protein YG5714_2347 [Sulfolobus islandicus Y.G.57.14]
MLTLVILLFYVLGVVEGWKRGDIVGLGVHAVMRMIVMLLQL